MGIGAKCRHGNRLAVHLATYPIKNGGDQIIRPVRTGGAVVVKRRVKAVTLAVGLVAVGTTAAKYLPSRIDIVRLATQRHFAGRRLTIAIARLRRAGIDGGNML